MTNTTALRDAIDRNGKTQKFCAEKLGITREGFYKKVNNLTEFKASEITKLTKTLNLSGEERDAIFFASEGEYNSLSVMG